MDIEESWWKSVEWINVAQNGDMCGPGSVVGIAIGYGLNGQGIEYRGWRDFPHLSRLTLGPNHPSVQWVLGLSWE